MALNASTSILATKARKQQKRQSLLSRIGQPSYPSSSAPSSKSPSSPPPQQQQQLPPQPEPQPSQSITARLRMSIVTSVSRRRESSSAPKSASKTATALTDAPAPPSKRYSTGSKQQPRYEPSTKPLPALPQQQQQQQQQRPQSQQQQQTQEHQHQHQQQNRTRYVNRDPRKRLSMYAQQAAPRILLRRPNQRQLPPRPVSQMAPVSHQHFLDSELLPPWRRCSTADILSDPAITRTRSNSRSSCCSLSSLSSNDSNLSTRSSSVSSLPTPKDEQQLSPGPTPAVSFSALAFPLQLSKQQKRQRSLFVMTTINNNNNSSTTTTPPSSEELRPSRAKSMFVNRKETRAISVWRDTMAKLENNHNTSTTSTNTNTTVTTTNQHTPIPRPRLQQSRKRNSNSAALVKFVLHELYTTEQSYHRLLTVIKTRYMQPMSAAASYISTTKPFISSTTELMPLLFRHLPDLLAVSEKILAGLKRILQLQRQQLQLQYVGQLFCSLEQDLVVFLKYAVHYESNIKSIRRACATNSMFLKIEQEGIAKRETNRMGFADYLIAPFQRVPRYCLLIKDLMKHSTTTTMVTTTTTTERPDADNNYINKNNLDKTLQMLTGLAFAMDHVQKTAR